MGRWAILNGVLLLIVALLGVQIAWTWRRALPPIEVASRGADPAPKDDGKPDGKGTGGRRDRGKRGAAEKPEQQPAVLVTTIISKDLFDPSRQKASEEVKAPAPKEAGPPPNLTLVGVRMIGRDREILVTDVGQGNQQKRLRVGDQLGGYTLKTIQPSRVTLSSANGDVVTLTLAVDKSGGAAPAAAPGRPPGAPVPPRPGQPAAPGVAGIPAAGVATSPAAGIQPRPPRAPAHPPRPGVPSAPGTPPAAGVAPPPGMAAGAANPAAPAAPPPTLPANLPAAVREKLEQLKGN
jgi:hypothetical protein